MISSISGRIPSSVEDAIKKHLANYASNITSVLSQFPSQRVRLTVNVSLSQIPWPTGVIEFVFSSQIANVVDAHAATLTKRAERDAFFLNTQSIVQLVQRSVQPSTRDSAIKIVFPVSFR